MAQKICEILNEATNQCDKWVDYVPQYIIPQLSLQEAVTLGFGYWAVLLVAWGITEIRFSI